MLNREFNVILLYKSNAGSYGNGLLVETFTNEDEFSRWFNPIVKKNHAIIAKGISKKHVQNIINSNLERMLKTRPMF
jgi:hypothetical protein